MAFFYIFTYALQKQFCLFTLLITPVTPSNAPPIISTRLPSFPMTVSLSRNITLSSVREATRIKFSIFLSATVIMVCSPTAVWSIIYLSGFSTSFLLFSSLTRFCVDRTKIRLLIAGTSTLRSSISPSFCDSTPYTSSAQSSLFPAGPAPPLPSPLADTSPSSETTSWGHHTSLCRVPCYHLILSSSSYHSGLQSLYDFNISLSMQCRCRPTSCLSRYKYSEKFLFFFNLMHLFNIISHAILFRSRQSSQKPL